MYTGDAGRHHDLPVMQYVDVVVDGGSIWRKNKLLWKGIKNQRVIDEDLASDHRRVRYCTAGITHRKRLVSTGNVRRKRKEQTMHRIAKFHFVSPGAVLTAGGYPQYTEAQIKEMYENLKLPESHERRAQVISSHRLPLPLAPGETINSYRHSC